MCYKGGRLQKQSIWKIFRKIKKWRKLMSFVSILDIVVGILNICITYISIKTTTKSK